MNKQLKQDYSDILESIIHQFLSRGIMHKLFRKKKDMVKHPQLLVYIYIYSGMFCYILYIYIYPFEKTHERSVITFHTNILGTQSDTSACLSQSSCTLAVFCMSVCQCTSREFAHVTLSPDFYDEGDHRSRSAVKNTTFFSITDQNFMCQ